MEKKEFTLYEGMIRDDLDILDKTSYFPQQITLQNVQQLFQSINSLDDLLTIPQNKSRVLIYGRRFVGIDKYGIYVTLKWLVYSHKILAYFKIPKLFQFYQQILSKISLNNILLTKNNFQAYIKKILIKPYIQYLQKLSNIKINSTLALKSKNILNEIINCSEKIISQTQYSQTGKIDKTSLENISDNAQQNIQNWYKMYNFLIYTLEQFSKPIKELIGYFEEYYPFLNNFHKYIRKDVKLIHSKLNQEYPKFKQSQIVSLIQMETLDDRVHQFLKAFQSNESLMKSFLTDFSDQKESKSYSLKVVEFLQSQIKMNSWGCETENRRSNF